MHEITRRIEIDYGHTLPKHMGFCNQLHGHRGVIKATVTGEIKQEGSETGMVMDFGFLKKLMMEKIHAVLDHGFVVWKDDITPIKILCVSGMLLLNDSTVNDIFTGQVGAVMISTLDFVKARNEKVLVTDDPPTAECLAKWCFEQLEPHMPKGVELVQVQFFETPNGDAVYKLEKEK